MTENSHAWFENDEMEWETYMIFMATGKDSMSTKTTAISKTLQSYFLSFVYAIILVAL